jgi:hypothetical protein
MRKWKVNSQRSKGSRRRDAKLKVGALWHFDIAPLMTTSHDGFCYAMVTVEHKSRFLKVFSMKDKSADSVIASIEKLRVFTEESGKKLEELRGDFDTSVTVNGRGDDVDTAPLKIYKQRHAIRTQHSPPNTQALNQAEPFMDPLFAQMNVNLIRAGLSFIEWWDMLDAAADQLNTHSLPGDRQFRSRHELFFNVKPDVSRWIAYPGQWVYVSVEGAKANRGAVVAEPAIFIKPALKSSGSLVRLFRSWKAMHYHSVRTTDDDRLRLAELIENDSLNAQHCDADMPQAARSAQLRALFRKDPVALPSDMTLAVIDRMSGMPIKLVPALDDNGQITMIREPQVEADEVVSGTAVDEGVALGGAAKASMQWEKWSEAQVGKRLLIPAKMIDTLPDSTRVRFEASATKTGKSHVRFEKYRKVETIKDLREANFGMFKPDFQHDLAAGLMSVQGLHCDSTTKAYTFTSPPISCSSAATSCATVSSVSCSLSSSTSTTTTPSLTPHVYRTLGPCDLENKWTVIEDEDLCDIMPPDSSIAPSVGLVDLTTLLQQDLLAPPGKEQPLHDGMKENLREVEALVHSAEVSNLDKLAELDATLAALLELEKLEGVQQPPAVSNASAELMAMDPFELSDLMEGFTSVTFAPIAGSGEAVRATKRGSEEQPMLTQALQSKDKDKWRTALGEDVSLMERHGAIKLVNYARYDECVQKYGADKVDKRDFVFACKVKRNVVKNEITKYKVRGCVGDAVRLGKAEGPDSATVAPSSRKMLAQILALNPSATSAQNDVQGCLLLWNACTL